MAQVSKKVEQLFEQFKTGLALAETARNTEEKKTAVSLAKQGLALIRDSSAAFMDFPEEWCGTRPKMPKIPKKDWRISPDNPLLDPDYQYINADVLAVLENLRGTISSLTLKENLKDLSKSTLDSITL